MHFEGDRDGALRLLRVVKHRFGATDRVGMFRMGRQGIESLDDPSGLLLADRRAGVPGSAVVAVLEGHRPVLVEVQALVSPRPAGTGGYGTRTVTGLVPRRIDLILASRALAEDCSATIIDTRPRKLEKPSDHAPVLAVFR